MNGNIDRDYHTMLQALADSRTVVLSLLRQLDLQNVNESHLQELVRKCALDLVHRKPVIETAMKRKRRRAWKPEVMLVSREGLFRAGLGLPG